MIEFADAAMSLAGVLAFQRPGDAALPCRVAILDAQGVRSIDARSWDALGANALQCNPWLSRQMVLAGLDTLEKRSGFRAAALYINGTDELIGFLPFRVKGFGPLAIGHPALNIYQVGGTPLISRDHAALAMRGLFGLMARPGGLPRHWIFPHVPLDGPFMDLVKTKAERMGLGVGVAASYSRPVLTDAAQDFSGHIASVIGKKRARDIERNLRRLSEIGNLTFERVTAPDRVAKRIEDFLRIEASGWKGRRGTALLSRPGHAEFARRAFGDGLAVTDSLLLDGEPIAVSVNIGTGATLFTPKCAFDERFKTFGPGMVLEYKVIERFFAERSHESMDAATTIDGHVIAGLWGETKPMGTLVVSTSGRVARGICSAIESGLRAKARLKRVLKRA